jgi:peptidoglycan/LPS O-acetylase OafA/YrhL
MTEATKSRIFGLDILRTIAIFIVVIAHSDGIFIKQSIGFPLPDGVDLFFVLSGYLIGSILIKTIEKNNGLGLNETIGFLQRRWFRTLPNYFLFLLINILLVYVGLIKGTLNKYLITFFVFLQNFHKPYDFLFWESWSLSVEEWFYLLFPLLLILFFAFNRHKFTTKTIVGLTVLFFLIAPLTYRIYQFTLCPSLDFDLYCRKLVLTRLDTIGFGLLAAYIHYYYPDWWPRGKNIFFVSGFILLIWLVNIDMHGSFFISTFYYSIIGLSVLMLLPFLSSLKTERIPMKPFAFFSKISYSMYLVHTSLIQIYRKKIVITDQSGELIAYTIFWTSLIFISYLVYRFYEKPLMSMRDTVWAKKMTNKITTALSRKK